MRRSPALISRNLNARRAWARCNHRNGVKRWAVARSVFMFSAREAANGNALIHQSNFGIRCFDFATGETR